MYPKSPTSGGKTTVLGVISGDWLPKGLDTDQVESLIKDYQQISGLSFLSILNVFHFWISNFNTFSNICSHKYVVQIKVVRFPNLLLVTNPPNWLRKKMRFLNILSSRNLQFFNLKPHMQLRNNIFLMAKPWPLLFFLPEESQGALQVLEHFRWTGFCF